MNCKQARRLLSVRREWTARERAVVAGHLDGCPSCRAVGREYELIDRRLDRLPALAPAISAPDAALVRAAAREQVTKSRAWAWSQQAIQVAALVAVVALVVVAALVWQRLPLRPLPAPAVAPAPSQVATPLPQEAPPEFICPVSGDLTQAYWDGHQAVDLANRVGTPVYAAAGGEVAEAGQNDNDGYFILLDHDGGYTTFYSHLRAIYARPGEPVSKGQKIGEVGATGKATGPHLHFEIRKDGERLNPAEVVAETEWAAKVGQALSGPEAGVQGLEHVEAGRFVWPVSGTVTQDHWSGHKAVDIAGHLGAPVHAAAGGAVVLADQDEDRHGIHLLLDHGEGFTTFYSHLDAAHVETGEHVEQGQQIGTVGSTGQSTGPHLHFEIRHDGECLNPLEYLP